MVKKTTEQFIENAKQIHGDKYNYSQVNYLGAKHKIEIICNKGHIFNQTPNDHLNGHGCKICVGWGEIINNPNLIIERSKKVHGDRYDYSQTIFKGFKYKINIKCKIHGIFKMNPSRHIDDKQGCPICGYIKSGDNRSWKLEKFIIESNNIHNNLYNYSKSLYKKATIPVEIICNKHGSFFQQPKDHINQKQGCPECNNSKGEILISNILKEYNIKYISQYRIDGCINPKTNRKLPFDFYLPNKNICIEFDGEQHFKQSKRFKTKLEDIQYRDNIKTEYCINNGIKLLRISYKNIKNTKEILKNKLYL